MCIRSVRRVWFFELLLTPAEQTRDTATFTPRFDIWEATDEVVLSGDLPGVTADDLEIEFEKDQLMIRGRVFDRRDDRKQLYSEYEIGDFHWSFTIGESIDASKISAEISDGVLTIRLPKSERVKPRRIEVK